MEASERKVLKVIQIGGRVTEHLSCGHKVQWYDTEDWKELKKDTRKCYECARQKAKAP